MSDMTTKRRGAKPPKATPIGEVLKDWRDRIPPSILAEAEAEGPAPLGGHDETPEQARERVAASRAAVNARYLAGVPVMYREASTDDLSPEHRAAIGAWVTAEGTTLVLAGQVGTGKTHAAYAVAAYLVGQGFTLHSTTLADYLAALRPDGDPLEAERAKSADVLLLDDLGAAKASEWAQEQVTTLLDTRLREERRQIVTTNHPEDALEEAWGSRAMDRLRFRRTVVVFTGESRRKAAW